MANGGRKVAPSTNLARSSRPFAAVLRAVASDLRTFKNVAVDRQVTGHLYTCTKCDTSFKYCSRERRQRHERDECPSRVEHCANNDCAFRGTPEMLLEHYKEAGGCCPKLMDRTLIHLIKVKAENRENLSPGVGANARKVSIYRQQKEEMQKGYSELMKSSSDEHSLKVFADTVLFQSLDEDSTATHNNHVNSAGSREEDEDDVNSAGSREEAIEELMVENGMSRQGAIDFLDFRARIREPLYLCN